MEDKLIEILVQGGLTSVALLSLWINYKIASNHINHNTDALTELSKVMEGLKTFIENQNKK